VLHISIWGIEAFSGWRSGDGTEFWAPCDSVGSPPIGGYGVRLIRLCLSTIKTEQNEVHVPTANDGEHLSALITLKFSATITHTPGILTRVISTQAGVVTT